MFRFSVLHPPGAIASSPTVDNTPRYPLYFTISQLRAIHRAYAPGFAVVHLDIVHAIISRNQALLITSHQKVIFSLEVLRTRYSRGEPNFLLIFPSSEFENHLTLEMVTVTRLQINREFFFKK